MLSRGQTRTFSAAVQGPDNPDQAVSWSVEGGGLGTFITSGGLLTVAADESAPSLTVRATSTYDTTKSGTATVLVLIYGITGFSFGGTPGIISGTNITVGFPYSTSAEITSLVPLITVTPNATVYPPSGVPQNFSNPVIYSLTAADGFQAVYTVTLKNSRARITGFGFANPPVTGIIDETAKTISVAVPYNTNTAAMAPAISVSPKAAVSPAAGTAQNFTNPVSYTVTAENGSTAAYTVTLTKAGQGGLTLIYPEDAASGAFTADLTLSKSGAEGKPTAQTFTVNGEYDTYRWRVDGTVKGNGKNITLDAAGYTTGGHQISVEVTRYGVVYSKSGSFRVEN
jgi:hypothetical protein